MLRTLAVSVLWVVVTASGGTRLGSEGTRVAQTTPGNCETNSADLNTVAKEELNRDGVIVAVARLGNGETSRTHNRRRLRAVEQGLIASGLPAPRVVLAEGERVKGYGRVEMYAAGKLRMVLLANTNKAICTECCNPDPADIRPDRESQRRRR